MLNLLSDTSEKWLVQIDRHLDEILIDHAHCEKKAAGTAMNLIFAYVENEELLHAINAAYEEPPSAEEEALCKGIKAKQRHLVEGE